MSFRPRIIVVILLSDKGLVKTLSFGDPVYIGDPINVVKIFNDLKADELVILDIHAAKKYPIQFDFLKRIAAEAYMPVSYGGGIRTLNDTELLIKNGIEKVIVNTGIFEKPELVSDIAMRFGSQSVTVCIDYKSVNDVPVVFSHGGTKNEGLSVYEMLAMAESKGAGELLISSVDRDGRLCGYDEPVLLRCAELSRIPVVALGGGRDIEDFAAITRKGVSAAAAGATFVFMGSRNSMMINYPDEDEIKRFF
jgi:imidazole glycerol-phosphate synthase subunit HisF